MAKRTKKPTSVKEGKFLKKNTWFKKDGGQFDPAPLLTLSLILIFSQLSGDVHAVLETLYAMQVTRNRFQKQVSIF